MKREVFFCAIGFWIVTAVSEPVFTIGFGLCFLLFMHMQHSHKLSFGLWGLLLFLSLLYVHQPVQEPKEGEYTIYQIKEKYALATDGRSNVLIYGLEDPDYYDVAALSGFEEIHSVQNISLFSFSNYCKEEKVIYSAQNAVLVRKQPTLKSGLYRFLTDRNPYARYAFYGMYSEELPSLLSRLSLPLMGLLALLDSLLKRIVSRQSLYYGCSLAAVLLFGSLFLFSVSLVRVLCARFSRCFFTERENRISCSILLFLFLMPEKAGSFAFVFPILSMLIFHLCEQPLKRIVLSKLMLVSLQFLYFGQVDLLMTAFFGFLQKISLFLILFGMDLSFFEHLPSLTLCCQTGFLYAFICALCFFMLMMTKEKKKEAAGILILTAMPLVWPYMDPFFTVTVFDIGQGDCTLITEPFHQSAVLIDCGQNLNRDNMQEIVVPYLESLRIDTLDVVIITHDDFDHSGGLESLEKTIRIKQLITSDMTVPDVAYPMLFLDPGREAEDENDKSIVTYFTYDDMTYLWMGDASADVEKEILAQYPELKTDVLKLGHHGSETSSSYDFLNDTDPTLAIISAGYQNRYGHPDTEVLKRLYALGISNLNTADTGMIRIRSFHDLVFFRTAGQTFGIMLL